jgi:hypothetical protein
MNDAKHCSESDVQVHRICRLNEEGLVEEIDRRSLRPKVICAKCGAKADEVVYVCNPRQL